MPHRMDAGEQHLKILRRLPALVLSVPLYLQTLIAVILGGWWGLHHGRPSPLGLQFANWTLEAIKGLAIPLLFCSIIDALLQREFQGKGVARLALVALINALAAITISLTIANVFQPGQYMPMEMPAPQVDRPVDPKTQNVVQKVAASPMMIAIAVAIALGLTLLAWENRQPAPVINALRRVIKHALKVIAWLLGLIVHVLPIAIFFFIANVIAEKGLQLLGGLLAYFVACLAGMIVHIVLVYHTWILFIARMGLARFWRAAREPVIYSFGINSSLGTMPMTLTALDRLRVSPASARLSACVGTNFNNDGILLYEVVAVLFISQAYGQVMGVSEQFFTTLICMVATMGIGGIPEAGYITLQLVLAAVGLPGECVTTLLAVDWVLARCRSIVNVLGDMSVAVGIDALSGRRFDGDQEPADKSVVIEVPPTPPPTV